MISLVALLTLLTLSSIWGFANVYAKQPTFFWSKDLMNIPDEVAGFGAKGLPVFEPSPSLQECLEVIDSNEAGNLNVTSLFGTKDEEIQVTCDEIKRRGHYEKTSDQAISIAHVRIVYQDYHIQELVFNLLYSPANVFCYSVDEKASLLFQEQMQNLSDCFPNNVYIAPTKYSITSAGHNMDRAYLDCLRLIRNISDWKYVVAMQNYDLPLKTNAEMVNILERLNGSNSVSMMKPIKSRVPKYTDWSFKTLNLFYDSSLNDDRQMKFSKGNVGAVFSRPFVEFVVDRINASVLLSRLDEVRYGNDEMFFPSLNAEDNIDAPGGYTRRCINKNSGYIGRFISWGSHKQPCKSKMYRHGVCVYGYQDLPMFKTKAHLFVNKLMPSYDYTAIVCWARYLSNRARSPGHEKQLDLNFYAQLPNVLFNNDRAFWRKHMAAYGCGNRPPPTDKVLSDSFFQQITANLWPNWTQVVITR